MPVDPATSPKTPPVLHGRDPRDFQIAVLSALLAYGIFHLSFDVSAPRAFLILTAALATQVLGTRLVRLPRFDPKSALISGLSLCLLLRTNHMELAVAGAVIAVGSKFVFRVDGRHVFNPTNLALVALMLATEKAWVSPGQWGSPAFFGFLTVGIGSLVIRRAERSDVTWAFGAFYAAILIGRALWLGDPLSIPLHQLQSGSLLLFAFFMISDPKTTPDSRAGRIAFAGLVAAGAATVHFVFFQPNGFLWSLVALAPLVPVMNRLLPGRRFEWRTGNSRADGPHAAHHRLAQGTRPAGLGQPLPETPGLPRTPSLEGVNR